MTVVAGSDPNFPAIPNDSRFGDTFSPRYQEEDVLSNGTSRPGFFALCLAFEATRWLKGNTYTWVSQRGEKGCEFTTQPDAAPTELWEKLMETDD